MRRPNKMTIYKSKYLLKAEKAIKAGKYVAKDCEVRYVEDTTVAGDSYQELQKFKNTAADYEEVNIAILEALTKDKFQKEVKVELPSHKEKRELLLETEGRISRANNDSAAKDLFEGRENYKELVNDLNYPRGLDEWTRHKKINLGRAWSAPGMPMLGFIYGLVKDKLLKKYSAMGWKLVAEKEEKGEPYTVTGFGPDNTTVTLDYDTYNVLYLEKVDAEGIFDNRLDTWYNMPYYGKANHLGQLHILEGGPLHCPVKLGEATVAAIAAKKPIEDAQDACGEKKCALHKEGAQKGEAKYPEEYDLSLAAKLSAANSKAVAAAATAESDNVYAPRFVALAFRKFQKNFNERARSQAGKLSPKGKFLNIIEPKKGYQNKIRAYEDFLIGLKEDFFGDVLEELEDSKKIKNIDDFSELLLAYLKEVDEPITMVGYFEKYLNIYMTGLAIDIHDGDPSSDQEKIEFLEDPNYPVYAHFAKKEGFKIDPNVPWRLIADIRVEKMRKGYASVSLVQEDIIDGLSETIDIFKYYNSVVNNKQNIIDKYGTDPLVGQSLSHLNATLEDWYNDFISTNSYYIIVESTTSGTKITKKKRENVVGSADIPRLIKNLMLYAHIRNYECRNVLSPFKIRMLKTTIRSILNIYNKGMYIMLGAVLSLDALETMLGTYAARNLPLEQKDLTKIEKSWIMIPSFTKYL